MAESLTEMAKDLALALIENDLIDPADMPQQLQQIHASLQDLKAREARFSDGSCASGLRIFFRDFTQADCVV